MSLTLKRRILIGLTREQNLYELHGRYQLKVREKCLNYIEFMTKSEERLTVMTRHSCIEYNSELELSEF